MAATISLCLAASVVAAPLVFGPKTYTIVTGKPQTFTDAIAIDPAGSCDGKAVYIVNVLNHGVSSAVIRVNDAVIASETDFATSGSFERQVATGTASALTVELKGGKSGASLTISIERKIEEQLRPAEVFAVVNGRATFQRAIDVPDSGNHFVLIADNGPDSGSRVSAGAVRLNAVTVIRENELDRSVAFVRKAIALDTHNTIDLEITGAAGSTLRLTLKRELDESACGPRVMFDSPHDGDVVTTVPILVRGTAIGGRDLGITVNGASANVDFSAAGTAAEPFHWIAAVQPDSGPASLHAIAVNAAGGKGEAIRSITYAPAPNALGFNADPSGGIVPLSPEFHVSLPDGAQPIRYEFDLDGDGIYETTSASNPEEIHFTYATAGIHIAAARVTLSDGTVLTAAAPVVAQSFTVMDKMLRQEWSAFTSALASADIDRAVEQVAGRPAQDRYRPALELIRPTLSQFAATLGTIEPIWISANAAHYLLIRDENGSRRGYHVYFARDSSGRWKVAQF